MEWLIKIFNKLFRRNDLKLIEEPKEDIKNVESFSNSKNDFIFNIKRTADLERDDGNGYKIIPYMRMKDMI